MTVGIVCIYVGLGALVLLIIGNIGKKANDRNELIHEKKMLMDVRNGDRINVYHEDQIHRAYVINNYPLKKSMSLQVILFNGKTLNPKLEKYNSSTFKDFDILNSIDVKEKQGYGKNIKNDLLMRLTLAVAHEKYEAAAILRDAIKNIKE